MGAAVKTITNRRGKVPMGTRRARIERLRERLETETDVSIREAIKAQLRAFAKPKTG